MKALTLYQPWASLVAQGTKVYETRSWPPPRQLIGQRIAIHTSKSEVGRSFVKRCIGMYWDELPRGMVVCTARLVAAHHILWNEHDAASPDWVDSINSKGDPDLDTHTSRFPIDEYGDYAPGRWAWRLVDVEPLHPVVPARGHQGLWNWEPAS